MLSVLRSLPPVVRAGFVIVLAGAVVDTTYHLAPHRTGAMAWAGLAGHLVTLAGMVVAIVGVAGVGLRQRHP
ncbi:MAG: hypothetical protein LC792_26160 [Actinobacteria bacterium]|nr:hypothetical protein [Actinomycetota bacterium]